MAPTANGDVQLTNGDKPHSKVLSHLHSYPVVHDSVEFYKTNHYGAKSLSFVSALYHRFIAPLHPYLQTPYSYVSPYLHRADELGDSGLDHVDSRFPIVKEDTHKLKETVQGIAFLPVQLVATSKQYMVETFNDEYKKTPGEKGVVKLAKATISTELKVAHDGYDIVTKYLQKSKEEARRKEDEARKKAEEVKN